MFYPKQTTLKMLRNTYLYGMNHKVVELQAYNTFGVHASADGIEKFQNKEELNAILNQLSGQAIFILGGGSNVLFTKHFQGTVLLNKINGIEVIEEDEREIVLRCGAGENWHSFVMHCVSNGYGGIENLSLIPGSVGASPIQNIGAYGVEMKDVFHSLEALHIETREVHTFSHSDCAFGYRDSIFKGKLKGQYVILFVSFRLSKNHILNTKYGAIEQELEKMGVKKPSVQDVSDAVIAIRKSKLPNPAELGNAGSFFKNPVVKEELATEILNRYPNAPVYAAGEGYKKLAAGWLIEQSGLKGKRFGECGVHTQQALVLVNYGSATGLEVLKLSEHVIETVQASFGITLEREVNIL
jgi:UDP-N-acetylmuramate dehydrogenase